MQIINVFVHLFFPHESNNQKAKILHSGSLGILAVLLVAFQLVLNIVPSSLPRVLGYAANISPSEVIRLTNQQREAVGLNAVSENHVLDSAALAKGNDMLAKGYWAHFAPDGTSPWSFFSSFGYKYRYAGENLARDFADAGSAVNAWMNSPSHKENILNPNYKEIGIGVVEGSLAGVDTTIIVQFFGTPANSAPAIAVAKAEGVSTSVKVLASPKPTATPLAVQTPSPSPTPTSMAEPVAATTVHISPFSSTKNLSMAILGVLLLALSIDLLLVRRRRIARIGGRTLAHIAFLGMILAVILILKAGQII
ncbi:MAG TPA: CAP domain-containing protein [Patescibacteria group bacterium]|nr:CAP domain-containing protein [Patescibacteria group bacterium]